MISAPLIKELEKSSDPEEAGGKAAQLRKLIELGLRVPKGALIPDNAFQRHLLGSGAALLLQKLHSEHTQAEQVKTAAQIRDLILRQPLDSGLLAELKIRFFSEGGGPLLAVRSSALGEDSAETSFAGQLDSFLNVSTLESLEGAIRATWASAWSERSLAYQRKTGSQLRQMGVVVQAQVRAEFSGVLFSESPAGGYSKDTLLIEYVSGLGDRLVSGEQTPGRLVYSRATKALLEYEPEPESDVDIRNQAEVLQVLVSESLRIEENFGTPVDIEWSIAQDGALFFLQARPITGISASRKRDVLWSNSNMAENYPEPVVPVLYSIAGKSYTEYFRNLALGFGFSKKRIDAMSEPLDHIIGAQAGRLYYNLTNIHSFLALAPFGGYLCRFFDQFIGLPPDSAPIAPGSTSSSRPRPCLSLVRLSLFDSLREMLIVPLSVLRQYVPIERRVRTFERLVQDFILESNPEFLRGADRQTLLGFFRRFLDIRFRHWNNAALADTATMVSSGALRLLLPEGERFSSREIVYGKLLAGLTIASNAPVVELFRLSRQIREIPELFELFTSRMPEEILTALKNRKYEAFASTFDEYLANWGFRSSNELLLTRPSPRENPLPAISMLKQYVLLEGPGPEEAVSEKAARRRVFEDEVRTYGTPPSFWPRWIPASLYHLLFRRVLRMAQGSIRLRERARFQQAKLYVRLRDILLEIGKLLSANNELSRTNDVFFLTFEEIDSCLSGRAMFPNLLQTIVVERQREYQSFFSFDPPENILLAWGEYYRGTQESSSVDERADSGQLQRLLGTGASAGTASAPARVLETASDGGKLQPGEILVTRQTDPGWASVFPLVKGLVIERGGMLSHGAIIAREYGIPAVVGVRDITQKVEDGEKLHIDGDRGIVEFNR